MKVKATQQLEVDISPEEQKQIVLDYLYTHFNWYPEFFISQDSNRVFNKVQFNGPHSWEEIQFVRNASPLDYSVSMIIERIKNLR